MPSAFLGANGRSSGILSEGTPSCLDVYINVRVLSNVKILRSHSEVAFACVDKRQVFRDSHSLAIAGVDPGSSRHSQVGTWTKS